MGEKPQTKTKKVLKGMSGKQGMVSRILDVDRFFNLWARPVHGLDVSTKNENLLKVM